MESRRMPLPTARFTSSYVDTARNKGSGLAACADPQVCGVLRRGEFEHRQVCARYVQRIQCRNVQGFPQKIIASPFSRQTHGGCSGQCSVSPRCVAGTVPAQIPQCSNNAVLATIQSATRTNRTGLEARSTNRHPQSLLRYPRRSAQCHRNLFRSLAKC
jgi:hypothetical protein